MRWERAVLRRPQPGMKKPNKRNRKSSREKKVTAARIGQGMEPAQRKKTKRKVQEPGSEQKENSNGGPPRGGTGGSHAVSKRVAKPGDRGWGGKKKKGFGETSRNPL